MIALGLVVFQNLVSIFHFRRNTVKVMIIIDNVETCFTLQKETFKKSLWWLCKTKFTKILIIMEHRLYSMLILYDIIAFSHILMCLMVITVPVYSSSVVLAFDPILIFVVVDPLFYRISSHMYDLIILYCM